MRAAALRFLHGSPEKRGVGPHRQGVLRRSQPGRPAFPSGPTGNGEVAPEKVHLHFRRGGNLARGVTISFGGHRTADRMDLSD